MTNVLRISFAGLVLCALGLACRHEAAAGEAKAIPLSPANTKIEWVGFKPDGKHVGGFGKFTGAIERDGAKLTKITLDIDTDSLTSDNPNLTRHLKSPDFFECLNFPKATFVATKIEAGSDVAKATHTITGDLTLRGKTKVIHFPATVSADKGFSLKSDFAISKKEFGMTYGTGKIEDQIKISVSVITK